MPAGSTVYIAFNRGIVSRLALARVDIKRVTLSARRMVNWMPRVLGSMMLRPGLGYLGSSRNNLRAKFIPFVFASDDTAAVEITEGKIRVWVDDTLLSRQSVSAAITNGTFDTDLTGWTSADEAGASSAWDSGNMALIGTGTALSVRRQEVPFSGSDAGKSHSVRVSIARGPVSFRVGVNAGAQDVFSEASLGVGTHSIAFTPIAALSSTYIGPALALSNNTTLTMGAAPSLSRAIGAPKLSGKFYFEVKMTVLGTEQSSGVHVGVCTTTADTTTAVGQGTNSWGYWSSDGRVYHNGVTIATGSSWGLNDVIGVALDIGAQTMALYKNNVLQTTISSVGSVGSSYYPAVSFYALNRTVVVGLTSSGCTYSPPPGFSYWGGSFFVEFQSRAVRRMLVDSCVVESSGPVEVDAPWVDADLDLIRHDQSGDVIFVACRGKQQRRIERRSNGSWSVVLYAPEDGPFRIENVSTTTLTPSAISGNITLTASTPVFRSGHVGAIFSLTSEGQRVERSISTQDSWTDPIRVTGVGTERGFTVIRSGTWVATITLQRSMDFPGDWSDVTTYSTNGTVTFDDTLDNQVAYYRIGIKTGQYASGTAVLSLSYGQGSITGVARVTSVSSPTSASAEVVKDLGGTLATDVWAEGEWSDYRGWPTAVAFHEGRLFWAGKDGIWGSVSDAFDSHDPNYEGDAGPISRTIGSGPVDTISWLLSIQRMIAGGEGAEFSCRSSSFDEPLTPTNFNLRRVSTQGSARVSGALVDSRGIMVQRGGVRVFELSFDTETYDYASTHISMLKPDIGKPGITRLAVQRQPDTRVHFVRSDGTVAVLVYDKPENVLCWLEVETTGDVEDVFVLPSDQGEEDDHVYYLVKRTVNGSEVRYLERWAQEAECNGGSVCKLADAHVTYSGAPVSAMSGLSHLEGEEVIVWADGEDLGTFTVSSGQIALPAAKQNLVAGLYYDAEWESGKLSQLQGIALTRDQQIQGLGLILADTHAGGLRFGPDFDHLDELPLIVDGQEVDPNTVHVEYDEGVIAIPGTWTTDSRVCLKAQAPRPCTVLAAVADGEVHG